MHLFFWAVWVLMTLSINLIVSKPTMLLVSFSNYLISIALFYLLYEFVYKPFLKKGTKFVFSIPLIVLFFFAFHFVRLFLVSSLLALSKAPPPSFSYLNQDLIAVSLSYFIQYALFSLGYWIAMSALKDQKRIAALEQENHELEKKQLFTEINFLKAQINPHFLYNTLNTLYSQAQACSEELAENILKLSEIMRYSLESLDNEKGTVRLCKELEHLQNLIDIHQLRFSNKLHIDYRVTGEMGDRQVPPLSIITAVENAFKYGDLRNPDFPLRIDVTTDENQIHFYCSNKKKNGSIEHSHGIGISNMKKRLDMAFANRYEIKTKDDKEHYSFELTVKN